MRQMKDSGIPWIGQMPTNWNCERGKFIFRYVQKPIRDDDGVITCFRDGEVTLRSNRREEGFTMADKEIGYQGIDVGDLVVHGMDGFAGAIGISDSRGKASPVLNVLDTNQCKRYFMYYLRSMAFSNVFVATATGIRVRSCDLRWNKLAEFRYPLPPIAEQHRIADFLDKKCAEIDSLTADVQKEIETLQEYRRSLITEAVTECEAPYVRFKYCASVKSNLVAPDNYMNYPQVSPETIEKDTGRLLKDAVCSVEDSGIISGNHLFFKGQILYSKIRPILNKVTIAPFDGLCSADMYPIETVNDSHYIMYAMLSKDFLRQVKSVTENRVKMPKINQEELADIRIHLPSIADQHRIADFLDKKCAEIDSILETKQKQLETLAEYRKSLIYEYVTGKKEVV